MPHPAILENPDQLATLAHKHGDRGAARMLGIDRETVARARRRHGIPARAPGRPRGPRLTIATVSRDTDRANLAELAVRIDRDLEHGNVSLSGVLATRVRAVHAAHVAGDSTMLDDALTDLAAAAIAIREHQRQVGDA